MYRAWGSRGRIAALLSIGLLMFPPPGYAGAPAKSHHAATSKPGKSFVRKLYEKFVPPPSPETVEAQAVADAIWSHLFTRCGGDLYYAGSNLDHADVEGKPVPFDGLRQFRGTRFTAVTPTELSEADRLNGIEWMGQAAMVSSVWREKSTWREEAKKGEWDRWEDGPESGSLDHMMLATFNHGTNGAGGYFVVHLWKLNGQWSIALGSEGPTKQTVPVGAQALKAFVGATEINCKAPQSLAFKKMITDAKKYIVTNDYLSVPWEVKRPLIRFYPLTGEQRLLVRQEPAAITPEDINKLNNDVYNYFARPEPYDIYEDARRNAQANGGELLLLSEGTKYAPWLTYEHQPDSIQELTFDQGNIGGFLARISDGPYAGMVGLVDISELRGKPRERRSYVDTKSVQSIIAVAKAKRREHPMADTQNVGPSLILTRDNIIFFPMTQSELSNTVSLYNQVLVNPQDRFSCSAPALSSCMRKTFVRLRIGMRIQPVLDPDGAPFSPDGMFSYLVRVGDMYGALQIFDFGYTKSLIAD